MEEKRQKMGFPLGVRLLLLRETEQFVCDTLTLVSQRRVRTNNDDDEF